MSIDKNASRNDGNSNNINSKSNFFRKAIPTMPKPLAIICCLLNIVLPGIGTLISSFSVFLCASHKYETNLKAFLVNFLAFSLQLCSAIVIFGWVWSIKYGLLFIHLSDKTQNSDSTPDSDLPLYVRRHSSMDANLIFNSKPKISGLSSLSKVKEEDDS